MGNQVLKKLRALRKILCAGILVQQEASFLQIRGQASPGRRTAPESGQVSLALPPLTFPMGRRRDPPQAELFCLMGPAPETEQNHPRDRQGQKQAHPNQLIRRAARPLVDPDGKNCADQLQKRIDQAGRFEQEMCQQQCGYYLRNYCQGAHRQAGEGRDISFCQFFL